MFEETIGKIISVHDKKRLANASPEDLRNSLLQIVQLQRPSPAPPGRFKLGLDKSCVVPAFLLQQGLVQSPQRMRISRISLPVVTEHLLGTGHVPVHQQERELRFEGGVIPAKPDVGKMTAAELDEYVGVLGNLYLDC